MGQRKKKARGGPSPRGPQPEVRGPLPVGSGVRAHADTDSAWAPAISHGVPPLQQAYLLARVLGHLDQRTCAALAPLVCRAWRTAAVAASRELCVALASGDSVAAFAIWVERHGHELLELSVRHEQTASRGAMQLPFAAGARLRALRVDGGRLGAAAAGSTADSGAAADGAAAAAAAAGGPAAAAAAAAAAPPAPARGSLLSSLQQLEQLTLWRVEGDATLLLPSVAQLTRLRTLQLCLKHGPLGDVAMQTVAAGAQAAWAALGPTLEHLELVDVDLGDDAVANVGACLTRLTTLVLQRTRLNDARGLAPLPPSLVTLDLSGNHWHLDASALLQESNGQLTALTELVAEGISLAQPGVLAQLPGLRALSLRQLARPEPLQLLQALRALPQQLERLELCRSLGGMNQVNAAVPLALVAAALEGQRQLTRLDLSCCPLRSVEQQEQDDQLDPVRTMPLLQRCQLQQLVSLDLECLYGAFEAVELFTPCDLAHLATACPQLEALNLMGRLHPSCDGAALRPLTALAPSLTFLALAGLDTMGKELEWSADDCVLRQLAELRGLRQLEVWGTERSSDLGAMELTALTALDSLALVFLGPGISEPLRDPHDDKSLSLGAKGRSTVRDQLMERCRQVPACVQVLEEQLEGELERKLKGMAEGQAEGVKAQREVAALRRQLAELRAGRDDSGRQGP